MMTWKKWEDCEHGQWLGPMTRQLGDQEVLPPLGIDRGKKHRQQGQRQGHLSGACCTPSALSFNPTCLTAEIFTWKRKIFRLKMLGEGNVFR